MQKKFKFFLIIFLISLPFWWGINIFSKNLENFFFNQYYQPPLFLVSFVRPDVFIEKTDLKQKEDLQKLDIQAKSAISVKINQNGEQEILFEKNPDEILPIASLTKLMTAWVVFEYPEYYKLSQPITISKEAIEKNGNFMLKEGEEVFLNDLLYSMLIESSNDAAYAIAENIDPTDTSISPEDKVKTFVVLMRLEAEKNLKLRNTNFVNSTGLGSKDPNSSGNHSTVKDLTKLAQFILNGHPEIFEISTKISYPISNSSGQFLYLAINKNKLLNQITNIAGGKTGWTLEAGGCILLVLENPEGGYFINVILGTDTAEARFSEMKKLITINE